MGTVAQDKPHTQHAGLHHPCPCGRRLLQGQLPAVRVQRWHRCRDWILLRQPPRRQDPDHHLHRQRPDRIRCRCPCGCPRRPRCSPCPRRPRCSRCCPRRPRCPCCCPCHPRRHRLSP